MGSWRTPPMTPLQLQVRQMMLFTPSAKQRSILASAEAAGTACSTELLVIYLKQLRVEGRDDELEAVLQDYESFRGDVGVLETLAMTEESLSRLRTSQIKYLRKLAAAVGQTNTRRQAGKFADTVIQKAWELFNAYKKLNSHMVHAMSALCTAPASRQRLQARFAPLCCVLATAVPRFDV